jgi:CubicO group peptidase (beta-lactamase class C family)
MKFAAVALTFALLTAPCSASSINASALAHLVERARATHSNALVVISDGRVIEDDNFEGSTAPVFAMSIAKSFCALAALSLVAAKKLALEQPIGRFVPEWKHDERRSITLRETLDMTTGLADPFASFFSTDSDDTENALRKAALVTAPGSAWRYNNNAIDLVNLAVHGVMAKDVDDYLQEQLFSPLEINNYRWLRDPYDHAGCAAGLTITAPDLAKIGELLLDDGMYAGKRLLPRGTYARLVIGIEALGSKGEYLYVSQVQHLVAARLIDANRWHDKDDSFDDFEADVAALRQP